MNEKVEHPSTPTPAIREARPSGLNRALAWVGIAAGSLFIVGSVFFSGYYLGQQNGGDGHQGPYRVMLKPERPGMGPDGMGPDGMGPDGPMGPRRVEIAPREQPSTQPSTPPRP